MSGSLIPGGVYVASLGDGDAHIPGNSFLVLGGAPPLPDPPQGTTTITGVTPASTTASVTYSYTGGDNGTITGYQYRLNAGAAAAIGASPATITGLTVSATYDLQVRAVNSNGSSEWSAIFPFTTSASAPDPTPPSGTITIGTVTVTHNSASVPWAYSTSDHTGVEYRLRLTAGAWGGWINVGIVTPILLSSLTASAGYEVEVRAHNADGSGTAASRAFTTAAIPVASTITVTDPLKNNTGTLRANLSGIRVAVLQAADLASIHEDVGLTTNGSGLLSAITDPAITTGQSYHVVIKTADGGVGITGSITAS